MALSRYTILLQQLLPQGLAWPRDEGAMLTRLLAGLAEELERVHLRADDLLERESDPRYAVECLPDWERMLGLPDPTAPAGVSTGHLAVVGVLAGGRGQTLADYQGIAESIGATVTQHLPEWYTCLSPCTAQLFDDSWAGAWFVYVLECDNPALLEWLFRERARAHAIPVFVYPS